MTFWWNVWWGWKTFFKNNQQDFIFPFSIFQKFWKIIIQRFIQYGVFQESWVKYWTHLLQHWRFWASAHNILKKSYWLKEVLKRFCFGLNQICCYVNCIKKTIIYFILKITQSFSHVCTSSYLLCTWWCTYVNPFFIFFFFFLS